MCAPGGTEKGATEAAGAKGALGGPQPLRGAEAGQRSLGGGGEAHALAGGFGALNAQLTICTSLA